MQGRRLLLALAPLVVVLAVACGGGGGEKAKAEDATATPGSGLRPGSPEDALTQWVQANIQKPFVDDCAKATDASKDAGKVCAALRGERGNQRAYVLGATFSEFNQWIFLESQNNQWRVVSQQLINEDNKAVPGIPWPLRTATDVVVAGAEPCLNVREGPGLKQKAIDCIRDGATIRLSAGPTPADGIDWWQVEGRTGWVAADYLRYPDARQ